jgi:hypothetical protein
VNTGSKRQNTLSVSMVKLACPILPIFIRTFLFSEPLRKTPPV